MNGKRVWSVVCPFCGRSYKRSVWDFILGSRLRGVLAFGQGRDDGGHWCKADVTADSGAALDTALGAGFFSRFKDRLVRAVFNWLGNGWLARDDIREVLNKVGTVQGGYPVMTFGPGAAEGGLRRDVAAYVWGSDRLDQVRSDNKIKVWG